MTASKSLKVEGDRDGCSEQSGSHSETPPFQFVTCRVEGNLDRALWRTPLTIACITK